MHDTLSASTSKADASLFLHRSAEWWDVWLVAAVTIAVLATILAGLTTVGSVIAHKRQARVAKLERQQILLSSLEQISAANSESMRKAYSDEAHVKMAKLQLAYEMAKDLTSRIESRQSNSNLALSLRTKLPSFDKVKSTTSLFEEIGQPPTPRQLTTEQSAFLLDVLKRSKQKGRIVLDALWVDAEAGTFADQLRKVFVEAGFDVSFPDMQETRLPVVGVGVHFYARQIEHTPSYYKTIFDSLEHCGISVGQIEAFAVKDTSALYVVVGAQPKTKRLLRKEASTDKSRN